MVKRVDTLDQLADIFTKPLARIPLEHLRMRIQGWTAMLSHGNMEPNTNENMRNVSIGHYKEANKNQIDTANDESVQNEDIENKLINPRSCLSKDKNKKA